MKNKPSTITRSIILSQQELTYNLRYSKKAKYLRLQINKGRDLELVLPRGYELKEAEKFLVKKADWIAKHLKKNRTKEFEYLFLGTEIKIHHEYDFFIKRYKISFSNRVLKIISPEWSKESIADLYEKWLRHIAKTYITQRVMELAHQYNFSVNKIIIRDQKTRWGSCSSKRNLSFNFKLMRYRKEVIDYVIIHELCHLKEMNHSKKFWSLVEKIIPDYKVPRKELKGGETI